MFGHINAGPLLEVEMSKKCTLLWREAHFQVKMYKAHQLLGPLLEVEMSKKCTPLWREAHFQVKMLKTHMLGPLLDVQMSFGVAGARDSAPCQKWAKRGLCSFSKTLKRRGAFEEDLERCISRGRRSTRETCSSEMLGGQGADFLRGVAFWSIRSSGLLRWFCVTGAALRMTWHHFCVAGAALYTDGVEKSQNALVRGRQLCTQLSICLKEVSQNCFVFDVVNFENWGSLSELLRFQTCTKTDR